MEATAIGVIKGNGTSLDYGSRQPGGFYSHLVSFCWSLSMQVYSVCQLCWTPFDILLINL